MKATFVIISVSERVADLNALVDSILRFPRFNDYDLNLFFQDPDGVADQIQHRDRFASIHVVPKKIGCHAARVSLLQRIKYDSYINLDDDMELTEWTDYAKPLEKVQFPLVGFVLTNWARTMDLLKKKVPAMQDKFVRQVLVYQGGGMVYSERVAEHMRQLPIVAQTFDHSWPLTAYVRGHINFRYLGSLAVHRVCGRGGMRSFMEANPVQLLMREYINFRFAKQQKGNGRDVLIPMDSDLTPLAHEEHHKNIAKL